MDMDDKARALVRLGCWEWMPGLAWVGAWAGDPGKPAVRGRILTTEELETLDCIAWFMDPADPDVFEDCRPVLDDPASEGLLLGMYRRASGHAEAWVEPVGPGMWQVNRRVGVCEEWLSGLHPSPMLAVVDALLRLEEG